MKLVAVIVFGLISPLLTDATTIGWLTLVSGTVDATGNYWLLVIVPAISIVVTVQALVLWWAFRAQPVRHPAIWLATWLIAETLWLNMLFNPAGDIARYLVIIAVVGAGVMALFGRFAWRRPA